MEAVNNPAEVMEPPVLVLILPEVLKVPDSLMVKVGVLLDWMEREVFVAPLVSFKTKALPVPALVKVKEVWLAKPLPKVKAMFRPVVVVIVLPPT